MDGVLLSVCQSARLKGKGGRVEEEGYRGGRSNDLGLNWWGLIPISPSEIPPLRVNVSLDASKRSLRSLWPFSGSSERNNHCYKSCHIAICRKLLPFS